MEEGTETEAEQEARAGPVEQEARAGLAMRGAYLRPTRLGVE